MQQTLIIQVEARAEDTLGPARPETSKAGYLGWCREEASTSLSEAFRRFSRKA